MPEASGKDPLADRLAVLKAAYADRIPARLDEIEAAARELDKDGAGAREALTVVHALAHKLAGSGPTFGFAALGAACAEIEDRCFDVLDDGGEPTAGEPRQVADMVAGLRDAVGRES